MSRLFRVAGALVASVALVLSGSLTAQAAGNSFSVTVKVLDKDTGELIDGKVEYWSEVLQKDVVFNNGAKITINANNLPDDWDIGSSFIEFYFEDETAFKYRGIEEYGSDDWPCRAYYYNNGEEVLCMAEKKLSTTLNVVDEAGKPLPLDDASPDGIYGLSSDGKTYYYWAPDESLMLYKPGYVTQEVSGLVNGGVTKVVLKKAPMREVKFNFVDARTDEQFTDMTGHVWPDGRDEEYSVSHNTPIKIPDYGGGIGLGDVGGVVETDDDGNEWIVGGGFWWFEELLDTIRAEIPTVHVRVVDENGNRVPGATVRFTDNYVTPESKSRVETKVSNDKSDVIYVPVFPYNGFCVGDCFGGSSFVSIDIQAPDGYENPEPVKEFPHQVPLSEFDFWDIEAPDSRVQYFDKKRQPECWAWDYETDKCLFVKEKEGTGELVTIKLKKKMSSGEQAVYRLYSPRSGEHLFTTDVNEYKVLPKQGWKQEGVAWIAPKSGTPLYRLYSPITGDHLYTIDTNEMKALVSGGWRKEGVVTYSGGQQKIYRQFTPQRSVGSHNYTGYMNEYETNNNQGWKGEGVAWYALRLS